MIPHVFIYGNSQAGVTSLKQIGISSTMLSFLVIIDNVLNSIKKPFILVLSFWVL
jgi:hypothetical protein